ncbi:MAG: adenylate/guanylate cyclase domain-containing protein, partial [Gammaproteobacteria bacterium]
DMLPVLSLLLENHSNRRTARTLLETYLGKHTGSMVLDGMVKRGDGETIHAVIWFCDLRDSTMMADTLPKSEFLSILNDFFDCMAGAVLDHGGEVLRFIGDAALAIFPIGGTSKLLEEACTPSEGACKRALDAARNARQRIDALNKRRQEAGDPPIRYGLALHVGDVMYGNIGVPQRLEFTVIGKAANEAARLEGMCKELGEPILISSAFPRCFPGEMRSLGTHSLRGVSEPQEVFALTD